MNKTTTCKENKCHVLERWIYLPDRVELVPLVSQEIRSPNTHGCHALLVFGGGSRRDELTWQVVCLFVCLLVLLSC